MFVWNYGISNDYDDDLRNIVPKKKNRKKNN